MNLSPPSFEDFDLAVFDIGPVDLIEIESTLFSTGPNLESIVSAGNEITHNPENHISGSEMPTPGTCRITGPTLDQWSNELRIIGSDTDFCKTPESSISPMNLIYNNSSKEAKHELSKNSIDETTVISEQNYSSIYATESAKNNKCSYCEYAVEGSILNHMFQVHNLGFPCEADNLARASGDPRRCYQIFESYHSEFVHMFSHYPWKCPACATLCYSVQQARTHVEQQCNNCVHCSNGYKKLYTIVKHYRTCGRTGKSVACALCPVTLFTFQQMQKHMNDVHFVQKLGS